MELNHSIRLTLYRLGFIAILTAGLSACQSTGMMNFTETIAPGKRIALQPAGPHQGEADTGDLVVAYTYRLAPPSDRQIHVTGGIRNTRSRNDMTNVYLNFVDNTGRVLDKKILYASGKGRDVLTRRPSTFDTTLPLPPEAVAIAFSSYVQPSSGQR